MFEHFFRHLGCIKEDASLLPPFNLRMGGVAHHRLSSNFKFVEVQIVFY